MTKPTKQELAFLWDEYEESGNGEQASLLIACEELGITYEEALHILTDR